jgi:hypothetical protein
MIFILSNAICYERGIASRKLSSIINYPAASKWNIVLKELKPRNNAKADRSKMPLQTTNSAKSANRVYFAGIVFPCS